MKLPRERSGRWILLVFSLPSARASQRVQIWRKLKKYGALALPSGGHLLPNTQQHQEKFEWLSALIRKSRGQASVMQVECIDELPDDQVVALFQQARTREYEALVREAAKARSSEKRKASRVGALRRRFQEIGAVDFFESPLRSRAEAMLARLEKREPEPAGPARRGRKTYLSRTWVTRPRPGIDRVSSAWLIRNFIDKNARFIFDSDPAPHAGAIPFDMFHGGGFGHRGDDCTFETLCKEFGIRDPKVKIIAQIIHDADLDDEKFGRAEGTGLDRVLIGWAQQGISDEELLRRGMEMIAGLYHQVG